jgi:hypothetical protein
MAEIKAAEPGLPQKEYMIRAVAMWRDQKGAAPAKEEAAEA